MCRTLCPFCVHICPCSSGSGDQGEISQPTFAAKLHFTYTKSKENSIFNLIFIDQIFIDHFFFLIFLSFEGGTRNMEFITLYHNHLAHNQSARQLFYFICFHSSLIFLNLNGASSPESTAVGYQSGLLNWVVSLEERREGEVEQAQEVMLATSGCSCCL